MKASLVFDGSGQPIVPASMGKPSRDQLQGTPLEKLGELASRICYDSLGNGRSSAKLHQHILEVINLSVYEHANFTVKIWGRNTHSIMTACLNRKGVWVEQLRDDLAEIEITANLRAILEWEKNTRGANAIYGASESLGLGLRAIASDLAPQIVSPPRRSYAVKTMVDAMELKTADLTADQAWVTLYLYGSRGFTHEQVRHRFAMSQRSTRYVDEDGSPYITHPLVAKFLYEGPWIKRQIARGLIGLSTWGDRTTYRYLVRVLEAFNRGNGLDKQTARKQARGASRGYLGNALASEMLFSAPVSGWQWILKQRASKFADAEIRTIYEPALLALKSSVHGHFFDDFNLVPSPDGMGCVLA